MNRRFPLAILAILLLGLVLSALGGIPFAHASVNLVQGPYEADCVAATCTTVYQSAVTAGNLAALTFWIHNTGAATVSDTDGATFTIHCAVGSVWQNCVASTTIANSHGATGYSVTVHGATEIDVSSFEISGGIVTCTATGTGASGTSATASPSCTFSSTWFILASASNNNANVMALGSNFSDCDDAAWIAGVACEYDTSSVTSPSTFPFSWAGSSAWQVAGIAITPAGAPPVTTTITSTITRVVACNFFQEQCWWIPTLYLGMYVGLWVGIAANVTTRPRSLTYVFLASTSFATLYTVLLGILPYPFAIMAFVAAIAYALRLDGVF